MLSPTTRILNFVASQILQAEDPEEVDLLSMDVAYAELARLHDQKNTLLRLKQGSADPVAPDLREFLEDVQINTSISEQAADLACGTLLETANRTPGSLGERFRTESSGLISSLSGKSKAGAHLAVCQADETSSRAMGRLDQRRTQVNGYLVRELNQAASDVVAGRAPLVRAAAATLDRGSTRMVKRLSRMRGIPAAVKRLFGGT